jgi:hypothetical protein
LCCVSGARAPLGCAAQLSRFGGAGMRSRCPTVLIDFVWSQWSAPLNACCVLGVAGRELALGQVVAPSPVAQLLLPGELGQLCLLSPPPRLARESDGRSRNSAAPRPRSTEARRLAARGG